MKLIPAIVLMLVVLWAAPAAALRVEDVVVRDGQRNALPRMREIVASLGELIEADGCLVASSTTSEPSCAPTKPAPKATAKAAPKAQTKRAAKPSAKPSSSGSNSVPKTVVFRKYKDRTENAFSVLVPTGWQTEGGIVRVDPNAAGGAAQSIEAKFDFKVKKDAAGTVMIHWLPHVYFADMRGQPAQAYFPVGSNYAGMTVLPVMRAGEFIEKVMFPYVHPSATDVSVVERKDLPKLAQGLKSFWDNTVCKYLPVRLDFQYDAAMAVVTYEEDGVKYKEILLTAIENRGPAVAGMWSNRFTGYARAPQSEAKQWEPVVRVIADSMKINPQWMAGEIAGQAKRGEIVAETQKQIQEIERQMTENRRKTNAEINKDMYLTVTGQSEYVNPFTKEVEVDSDDWKYRWVDSNGNRIMSNQDGWDPNRDPNVGMSGFKLTKPRK